MPEPSAPPDRFVLLLRGINVNPSTRVAMADLRDALDGLGYAGVRTLLQSGNVILESAKPPEVDAIEAAVFEASGVRSRVIAMPADEFRRIAAANPLLDVSDDLSKMVVTFLGEPINPEQVEHPTDRELAPERLVLTPSAIYQWCPNGILKSQLRPAWWRQFGPAATTRNVRTVDKILAALDAD